MKSHNKMLTVHIHDTDVLEISLSFTRSFLIHSIIIALRVNKQNRSVRNGNRGRKTDQQIKTFTHPDFVA